MAQLTVVTLVDDVDGSQGDETLNFALDGKRYEIDLSHENAAKLRESLAPWASAARRVSSGKRSRSRPSNKTDVRQWAHQNGFQIGKRGRIPAEVESAYQKANAQV